jgi:hypothetical protein
MKTKELFINRQSLSQLKNDNVLTGQEKSKKEIILKLINSEYSNNFIAKATNTNIAYVYKLNKQNKTK